jgi:hypothetical protein
MASGNDQTIPGIFADNDSENEDEFEGFAYNFNLYRPHVQVPIE